MIRESETLDLTGLGSGEDLISNFAVSAMLVIMAGLPF